MAVGEGKFVLYSRIDPPLTAGDYRLTAEQALSATGPVGPLNDAALPVASLPTHLRVRSPRYVLPPDQVLSTFPPANTEGSYGLRLPQIVIRRRTLPWERRMTPAPGGTPWLALVVIAEGEAELKTSLPVAECVTPGVVLEGVADSERGNCLMVRRSVMDRVFPTRLDVPLLAHAREVDIHDTELMMGDDDGFLAVVIANRLPLPGRDAEGNEVPVKYLACLVNLEGQFNTLLPRAPEPVIRVAFPLMEAALVANAAEWDRLGMGMTSQPVAGPVRRALPGSTVPQTLIGEVRGGATDTLRESGWSSPVASSGSEIYAEMARSFSRTKLDPATVLDPTFRFPVLLHWSFTSYGARTFRSIMSTVSSGLLGTTSAVDEPDTEAEIERARERAGAGRPPLEVVETGHVGLVHRTRHGDEVRSWYRGPFGPHPTEDPPEGRLALAHASDQLRIVVPDGREDLSLAGAFEVGRLLALSRPSLVSALLRWRQNHYQIARRRAVWEVVSGFLEALELDLELIGPVLGIDLGRRLTQAIVTRPEVFLGDPRPLVDAGRSLPIEGTAARAIATGFALPQTVFRGEAGAITERLRNTDVPVRPDLLERADVTPTVQLRNKLTAALDRQLTSLTVDTLAPLGTAGIDMREPGGVVRKRAKTRTPDALDRLLDALEEGEEP